jgi:long-chain acyl-CoA synthetase
MDKDLEIPKRSLGKIKADYKVKDLYKLTNGKYINPTQIENILMESEFIAQVFIYGDNKPFNIALIVCSKNITDSTIIDNEIKKLSNKMKKYEIPKKFLIVPPFTFDEKLLTAKMSMIRNNIYIKYCDQIIELYK